MIKKLLLLFILLLLLAGVGAVGGALYAYQYFTRDLPTFESIDDYQPPAVSQVHAESGALVGEFFKEKRYPVALEEVPDHVRNAFLAAEDSAFYSHPGIDLFSIFRAVVKNLQT
ncbi:MAG: transglycosylase domain-containing protein, partial [Bdellovibrionales bacterium]|nr:transglycosylase domain-containing protein [Bdellovibrionales bacterium]